MLIEDNKLDAAIQQVLNQQPESLDSNFEQDLEALDSIVDIDDEAQQEEVDIDDTPVVRFVKKILLDGIHRGASDIHVEPYEKLFRIRYRIDGVLEEVARPPLNMTARLIARIKVMSVWIFLSGAYPRMGQSN